MYKDIGVVFATLAFACSWIYCIAAYGFLIGVGFGWVPSLIVGWISAWVWPVYAIGILIVGVNVL